jgi:hypothetical protein
MMSFGLLHTSTLKKLSTAYRHQRQALQGLVELISEEDSWFSDSTIGLIAAFMLSNVSLLFFSGFIAFLGSMKNRSESFTQVQQSAYSDW